MLALSNVSMPFDMGLNVYQNVSSFWKNKAIKYLNNLCLEFLCSNIGSDVYGQVLVIPLNFSGYDREFSFLCDILLL